MQKAKSRSKSNPKARHRTSQKAKSRPNPKPRHRAGNESLSAEDSAQLKESTEQGRQCQSNIDKDWNDARRLNADRIDSFPELPSQQQILDSIADYRRRVSTPHLAQSCCGICAEQWNAALIQTFVPGDTFLCKKTLKLLRILLKAVHSPSTLAKGTIPLLFYLCTAP